MRIHQLLEATNRPDPRSMTPRSAYRYAVDVIEGRWPEAESIIFGDQEAGANYAKHFNLVRTINGWTTR